MTKLVFKGKKILFFSPKFFNYENEIVNELNELGAYVDYYDDRPENDFLTKALVRINKKILSKKINNYYDDIIKKISGKKYDYLFFLTPDSLTKEKLLKLKKNQKNSKTILYLWDSVKNRKNILDLLEEFDTIYSFDPEDCNSFNFKFRPLFYIRDYEMVSTKNDFLYDLMFIGTGHSDRVSLVNKIEDEIKGEQQINSFKYFYLPSKIIYYFRKLTEKSFFNIKIKEFRFKGLSQTEVVSLVKKSKVVLDIHHPKQNGLTMRTIEMLGANRKLITTNQEVKKYDFYDPNNICIIDRKKIMIDKEFFKTEYKPVDKKIYKSYSLENWLIEIFK